MTSPTPLSGKTAIITGGTKGIGAAIATHLVSLGANVTPSSRLSPPPSLSQLPPRALALRGDAGSIPDIHALVSHTVAAYGKIDIVIANAGVLPMADLAHLTEEVYDATMRLNTKGPLFLVQAAAPHMSAGGRIVLVSSTLAHASVVDPAYLPYLASKGAVEQMVRVLSKDLARKGIMVNGIAPGPTGTELFLKGKSEAVLERIRGLNPAGRIGEPEEVARVVGFLSGEGAAWVSGQMLRVNGGMA
ncbi:hypothetical protein VE01_10382 [Pseudogymnoascus verrucosus]|uniref:NAD(P)-binding protein n=1 Tax=Pseudogymnoascus verrucosus TaxID=342668 RepID=A0A1B8G6Y8_9PEZI|nr:uncharacterized protein VE01_10382 [Pseudogymnoascus verrucosus]OBT91599.1 hypothetical protein VE01_10382 [Pseudogymnoascus verrucosus]